MSRFHFFILVLLVSISGFSQGMLLPVISIIFETNGESAAINGLHATGLYIGVLWLRRLWKRRSESSGSSR